jgi:fructose-bisphosphate aldolase / 2-amino-3,7-dideoxy-D-threo-hept-6-ulosonate synthase
VSTILGPDGRSLIVAVDHPLYSWPCPGLEDREAVLRAVAAAGADAVICSYGTLRDLREAFGDAAPVMKLDVTTLAVGGHYPISEYALAYEVEDARRLGAAAVLTYVQLGTPFELEALRSAARVAARADQLELPYVCEIMPVEGEAYPDPAAPLAIAAAARTASELGARVVKTTMPSPPDEVAAACACGVPVVLAGGDFEADGARLLDAVRRALDAGAAGVAHGRNVWGRPDPEAAVAALRAVVHPEPAALDRG